MSHMPPAWEHKLHHPQPAAAANPLSTSRRPAPQPAMCTQSPGKGKVTACLWAGKAGCSRPGAGVTWVQPLSQRDRLVWHPVCPRCIPL